MCGSTEFTRRADDTAETVSNRLMAYYRDTAPLTGYYFCKGNLRSVDGMAPIEQVAQEIGKILCRRQKGALIAPSRLCCMCGVALSGLPRVPLSY